MKPNFLKRIKNIFIKALLFLFAFQIGIYLILQIPSAQTWLAQKIVKSVSKNINGEINVGKVYFVFFNRLALTNISIVDKEKPTNSYKDTLVKCQRLSVTLSPLELVQGKIKINTVSIANGMFNLQNEGNGITNLKRILKLGEKEKDTTASKSIELSANSLKIQNFRFVMQNPEKYKFNGDGCINFADLDVSDINININSIVLDKDTLKANINNISGTDKSGFILKHLEGQLQVSKNEARIRNLLLADEYSNIPAKYIYFQYNSVDDFSDFINKVKLGIDITDAFFSFKTIGRFTPTMQSSSLGFFLDGKAEGRINNIKTEKLAVTSESGLTFMHINAHLSGLPDVPTTMASIKIDDCYTFSEDIANIVSSINGAPKNKFLSELTPGTQYKLKANLNGLLYDFVVNGKLSSEVGDVNFDILMNASPKQKNKGVIIDGFIKTKELEIGNIINNKLLGKATLDGNVQTIIKDNSNGGTSIRLNSLKISELDFNNYNYKNISASGLYSSQRFNGDIICKDPNLDMTFKGLFSLDIAKNGKYDFYLNLPYANLNALNFNKDDSVSIVSLTTSANFTQTPDKDIYGDIKITNPFYKNSRGEFNFGDISLTSEQEHSNFHSLLKSEIVNAEYKGNIELSTFIKDLIYSCVKETASNYLLTNNENKQTNSKNVSIFDTIFNKVSGNLNINILDSKKVCDALFPQLYIAPMSTIKVTRNNDYNQLSFNTKAIAYANNMASNLILEVSKKDTVFKSNLDASKLIVKGIQIDSTKLNINGFNNNLNMSLAFTGDSTRNKALINSKILFENNLQNQKSINLSVSNSFIDLKEERWNLSVPELRFRDTSIIINNLDFSHAGQKLAANGVFSKANNDTLYLDLDRFNIKLLNDFIPKNFDFKGYLSGKADISYLNSKPNFNLDLNGDSIYVAGNEVGDLSILSYWDNENNRLNIGMSTKLNGHAPLVADGWFSPGLSKMDITAKFNKFTPAYFQPYLDGIISNMNGSISGNINVSGPLSKLEITSEDVKLNNLGFVVDFINVPYVVNGPVSVTSKGINITNATISDNNGGTGHVNGGIEYDHFKNMALDTKIDFKNLMALDTQDSDDAAFYGKAFASGTLTIKGPFNKINLSVNARSNKDTYIHVPLSNASTASLTNILTFTEPPRSKEAVPLDSLVAATKPASSKSQMDINLRMQVTPDAEIAIEINKEVGDVIKANGNGLINMQVSPWKNLFNMFGDYTINQGSYKFVVLGFASKDFIVKPGGTINFNGDISKTNLNLNAVYKTSASINPLISDTSSVGIKRNVECILGMKGQLMNPELSFNIDIPDLDPIVKAQVDGALSSEGQVQKQFMALLVSGGFVPSEQSGITNNSTILYSNASEILSNQINNVLQQLGIPIDLNLNYARGAGGTNVFDVGMSTSLFGNRVTLSGNMGNDPSTGTDRDVIGNFDASIKLDKNGRFRLNVFSHSTDIYSNSLDYSQRNGVGVVYQQGFDSFKQLFRKRTPEEKEMMRQIKENEKAAKEKAKQEKKQNLK